jgi:hypothetical protein
MTTGGMEERPRGSQRDREREHLAECREQSPPHRENIRGMFVDEESADNMTRVEEYRGGSSAIEPDQDFVG